MNLLTTISCVIIAKNSQETITQTLDSLKNFENVILYLNNSTDNTKNIAQQYHNVTIVEGEFYGFGTTKNKAASYAKNSWILSLDSDEIVTKELFQELLTLPLLNNQEVFSILRNNYFLGKHIKHSGWSNDFLIRLYNKHFHQFNANMVHESIETLSSTKITKLQSSFKHNAITNLNQFLQKVMKYSDLASENKKTCSLLTVILKSHFAFFKTYILQFGFLDGWRGLVIATSNFNGKFFRYIKRYNNCKK